MILDERFQYLRNLLPGKKHILPADLTDVKSWTITSTK